MRLFFLIIICLCLFLSLFLYRQSYQSIKSDVYIYRLMHVGGHHLHSKKIEINQSPSNISLNTSHTFSHSSIIDSPIHPIPVKNPSKEGNNHNYSSHNEDNPQETHPHSISHSSDVTFVSQLSTSRLFYFKYLLDKWQGQFSVTILYYNNTSEDSIASSSYLQSDRIQYSLYKSTSSDYPINKLRNMAIKRIHTTHFYMCDMDFWPSYHLYETLISMPDNLLNDEWLGMIVPGFQYRNDIKYCTPFKDCVEGILPLLPSTKSELRQCMISKNCTTFRPETRTHAYHYAEWFDEPTTKALHFLNNTNCLFMEPYIVIRKSVHMPLFDESFLNYGYNKQQWIENLRYIGYKFGVVVQGFGMDVPHPVSKYSIAFNDKVQRRKIYMKYKYYLDKLHKLPDKSVVRIEPSNPPQKDVFVNLK